MIQYSGQTGSSSDPLSPFLSELAKADLRGLFPSTYKGWQLLRDPDKAIPSPLSSEEG